MNQYVPRIADTVLVREIRQSTGEVIEYEKNVFEEEEIHKAIDYSKKRDELTMIMDNEFGKYFLYFYNVMNEYDIPIGVKARFLYLCTYVNYEGTLVDTNVVDKRCLSPLTRRDIEYKLGLSNVEFKITMKTLTDSGLLVSDGEVFTVNKDIINRGKTNKRTGYTRVFFNGIRELYHGCKPSQHKQLYYIFMILPYINLQHNVLCNDITEQMYEKITPISVKQMCEICGYDPSNYTKFYKNLLKFKVRDMNVIMISFVGENSFIRINPSVYYGGTRVNDLKDLMGQFGYNFSKQNS